MTATLTEIRTDNEIVLRPDGAARMTVDDLFKAWLTEHAAINLSERYATDAARWWDREIATRPIVRVRLTRLAEDPGLITRLQDELAAERLSAASRVQVLKILRSVLRWGRQRYPRTLTVELSGLFKLPSQRRSRLIYAADALAVERLIEAVLSRRARDPLLPLRDAALLAAMGFTVAARPSEWLHSATWGDVYQGAVEFQRPEGLPLGGDRQLRLSELDEPETGLKTGARAALLLPGARDRLRTYRSALEARHGPHHEQALVFQAVGDQGPLWWEDGAPVAWSLDYYKRWTARVWRPARKRAAGVPGVRPKGMETMRFYDLRHTAISMALHSTLVMTRHGMTCTTSPPGPATTSRPCSAGTRTSSPAIAEASRSNSIRSARARGPRWRRIRSPLPRARLAPSRPRSGGGASAARAALPSRGEQLDTPSRRGAGRALPRAYPSQRPRRGRALLGGDQLGHLPGA